MYSSAIAEALNWAHCCFGTILCGLCCCCLLKVVVALSGCLRVKSDLTAIGARNYFVCSFQSVNCLPVSSVQSVMTYHWNSLCQNYHCFDYSEMTILWLQTRRSAISARSLVTSSLSVVCHPLTLPLTLPHLGHSDQICLHILDRCFLPIVICWFCCFSWWSDPLISGFLAGKISENYG